MLYDPSLDFDELRRTVDSGIYWANYMHLTSTASREGICKTGQLLPREEAMKEGFIPLTGEVLSTNDIHVDLMLYLAMVHATNKAHISLSTPENHLCGYRASPSVWNPESSIRIEESLKSSRKDLEGSEDVGSTTTIKLIDEYIEFELLRRKAFHAYSHEQRRILSDQTTDVYVFGRELERIIAPYQAGNPGHPVVVGGIELRKYLFGMFTLANIEQTSDWIRGLVGRDIPVAKLDALYTWDRLFNNLPVVKQLIKEFHGIFSSDKHYKRIRRDKDVQKRIVHEVKSANLAALLEKR